MNDLRIKIHKPETKSGGMIIYRMSRDQRVWDNWALLFARQLAESTGRSLAVVFTLMPSYPGANLRHFDFMLRGLETVEQKLRALNIPFCILLNNDVSVALKEFIEHNNVTAVISDFDPLRHKQKWISDINAVEGVAHYEVDTHNIVPCWKASPKAEFGAYTLRPKIKRLLPEFLTGFPELKPQHNIPAIAGNYPSVREAYTLATFDSSVTIIKNIVPGEDAALNTLHHFISHKLEGYAVNRNNPCIDGQSGLSPYLHFGQLSAQRIAWEVYLLPDSPDKDALLEELIVRRELADNFCFYNPHYDSSEGFPEWARTDIVLHRKDEREYIYTRDELETATTHDPLWNAAQTEMVRTGKMHGYMRMYWAKKILEWTPSVETAMEYAIWLNDKYSLDGRDANGYAGIAWSIGGVHDRAWFPRPVFGKIRYMSYSGCKSKFDIQKYILKCMSLPL
ncbi:deoxyribodipyrimidine photo-lyase [Paludibacter jiangxiensis]|uniref:Deoxyribodipyrimidine photo-lyase n=1 Tax=Paludibacter jiangxiensis TaxID=681398 RepID=A0A171AQ73_9BACT|nr:deoxyribodipyrimidine photo-lyase [Paludibacter jiangxiensis]GAT64106.1 deoxyribodipyrimidine photo-lyase [Paludibacter jiangxiensis]